MSFARGIRVRLLFAAAVASFAAGLLAIGPAPAGASTSQLTMIQDGPALANNPLKTLQIFRSLGVQVVRVPLIWNEVALDSTSSTEPTAPYPDADWAGIDKLIREAGQYGIQVDLMPTGPAPLWATTPGAPNGFAPVWKPSGTLYGQFVQAAASRYTGGYTPPGASSPLPRVSFWELWNEGNWSPSLSPQVPVANSTTYVSAATDRSLIAGGWTALQQTGHGSDKIVYGSLSPDQSATVVPASATSISPPLAFLRALYCVDSSYQYLTGAAGSALNCPASKGEFVSQNPGLFKTAGVGVHPYGYGNPPTRAQFPNPNSVEFAEIPNLTKALTRIRNAYGTGRSQTVYNTEYGYEPRPPQRSRQFPTQATAATYINEAEYLSYKNPRIATYDQYLIYDGSDWFTTGLVYRGRLLPSFGSFRMPIWLPKTSTSRGRALEVWGCVRPAYNARLDTGAAQYAEIQFARGRSNHFTNLKRVRVSNSRGYIDLRVKFPASGRVRLEWQYPANDAKLKDPLAGARTIYSRTMSVRVR